MESAPGEPDPELAQLLPHDGRHLILFMGLALRQSFLVHTIFFRSLLEAVRGRTCPGDGRKDTAYVLWRIFDRGLPFSRYSTDKVVAPHFEKM